MKIAHVVQFGQNRSGLYEAARDMMRADTISGHEVFCVDKGFNRPNGVEYSPIGSIDDRAGFKVVNVDPKILDKVDIIIDHGGIPANWIVRNQLPIIAITHGRPLDSFNMEYFNNNVSFSSEYDIGKWNRIKKIVYFWPEFKPFWDNIYPEGKSLILDYPCIDQNRFNPHGEIAKISEENRGEFNILICDSWREDIDMFEIFNGVIQAAKDVGRFKLHFYSIGTDSSGNIKKCWNVLINELRRLGCMGESWGRRANMERVYRSMDATLTPHRIITRIVGESILCGTPVIADQKCKVAQFGCDPHDPYSLSKAIQNFIYSNQEDNRKKALEASKNLYLENYSKIMNEIYKEIIKR